jgi:hypothetical protein
MEHVYDSKVFQEWYCGNCATYIRFRLNMDYDRTVTVVCPSCGHRHQRYIKKGQIVEDGRHSHGDPKEELCPPKSACSKEPITKKMKDDYSKRDGAVIKSDADLIRDNFFRDRWVEIAARKGDEE